ncbi:hypothetical protein DFJ73DRAFT_794361 [Zopfochytrium polystomum]|nr:hypothetical protein DFJ73DRAFT_794361 [Zopfochytrium polystomum]
MNDARAAPRSASSSSLSSSSAAAAAAAAAAAPSRGQSPIHSPRPPPRSQQHQHHSRAGSAASLAALSGAPRAPSATAAAVAGRTSSAASSLAHSRAGSAARLAPVTGPGAKYLKSAGASREGLAAPGGGGGGVDAGGSRFVTTTGGATTATTAAEILAEQRAAAAAAAAGASGSRPVSAKQGRPGTAAAAAATAEEAGGQEGATTTTTTTTGSRSGSAAKRVGLGVADRELRVSATATSGVVARRRREAAARREPAVVAGGFPRFADWVGYFVPPGLAVPVRLFYDVSVAVDLDGALVGEPREFASAAAAAAGRGLCSGQVSASSTGASGPSVNFSDNDKHFDGVYAESRGISGHWYHNTSATAAAPPSVYAPTRVSVSNALLRGKFCLLRVVAAEPAAGRASSAEAGSGGGASGVLETAEAATASASGVVKGFNAGLTAVLFRAGRWAGCCWNEAESAWEFVEFPWLEVRGEDVYGKDQTAETDGSFKTTRGTFVPKTGHIKLFVTSWPLADPTVPIVSVYSGRVVPKTGHVRGLFARSDDSGLEDVLVELEEDEATAAMSSNMASQALENGASFRMWPVEGNDKNEWIEDLYAKEQDSTGFPIMNGKWTGAWIYQNGVKAPDNCVWNIKFSPSCNRIVGSGWVMPQRLLPYAFLTCDQHRISHIDGLEEKFFCDGTFDPETKRVKLVQTFTATLTVYVFNLTLQPDGKMEGTGSSKDDSDGLVVEFVLKPSS